MRSFTYDADTRTLVVECYPPSLDLGRCQRAVITNCTCYFAGELSAGSIDSRRLQSEPMVERSDAGTDCGQVTAVFEMPGGHIETTGGIASVDMYSIDPAELPLDPRLLSFASDWRKAA